MNISKEDGAVSFDVRVVPRSSKSEIIGPHDGALKVKLTSPPVDGAANAELIKLLAKTFSVAKSEVGIVSGPASKAKRVRIAGTTLAAISDALNAKS